MKAQFPKLITDYLNASNSGDKKSFLACFNEDAIVLDEGKTLKGLEAIEKWFTETRKIYKFTLEPLSVEEKGKELLLTAKVTGDFKGSPVTLKYRIQTESDRIQDLRIN